MRPQQMLERAAPLTEPVFSGAFAIAIAAIGAAGIYLVSRQWAEFASRLADMASVEGAIAFAIALAIVKSLHELGHAFTAVRHGCRVPTMGICFMVLVPMLYTDVSDAWRLRSRRKRLAIDGAGIAVETAVACVATFAWAFLSDGTPRSVACALATTSWVLSLGLNLNPFMRFDGYYILCDLTGIDNLQPRAFAIGRWRLRELLFDCGMMPPETLARATLRWLCLYAWATWLYRLIVFLGIALIVYQLGFKLLGITLFVIEIVYFIAGPVWREIGEWYAMRAMIIRRRRGLLTAGVLLTLIASSLVPLSSTILVPALVDDRNLAQIYPRRVAHIVSTHVRQGDRIAAGALIAVLASPEIEHEIRQTALRIKLLDWRLARIPGDRSERTDAIVLEQSRAGLASRMSGLQTERAELRVLAPIAGTVAEMTPHLHEGRWLQRGDMIALVSSGTGCSIRGYVSEDDVSRIDTGGQARFVPEDLSLPSRPARIERIAKAGTSGMDMIELSSHYGGGVAARPVTRPGEARTHIPVAGQFLLSGELEGAGSATGPCHSRQIVRGTLHVSGRAESLAARSWRRLLKVLVRESGF